MLPIQPTSSLERLATGATWSEGPLWLPESQSVIWSDIPGNRILSWSWTDGSMQVYREEVEFTNGRCWWNGAIVQCSHGRRAVEIETADGAATIVDRFGQARFNSPNDVTAHPDGSLWFTDPPYGIVQPHEGHPGQQEYGGCYVFRFDGSSLQAVITDVLRPNGLAFSPDGTTLYVSDTSAALGDGPDHAIRGYELRHDADGAHVARSWQLAEVSPGVPDGIAVDVQGRIWSSSASGVQVFSPEGTHLGTVEVPEVVGNVCFGGPDGTELYIAASTSLYRIHTETSGVQ